MQCTPWNRVYVVRVRPQRAPTRTANYRKNPLYKPSVFSLRYLDGRDCGRDACARRELRKFVGNSGSRSCVRSDAPFTRQRAKTVNLCNEPLRFILITGATIVPLDTVILTRAVFNGNVRSLWTFRTKLRIPKAQKANANVLKNKLSWKSDASVGKTIEKSIVIQYRRLARASLRSRLFLAARILYVGTRGNQLIHCMVQTSPTSPLLSRSSCPLHRPRRSGLTSWAYMLSFSLLSPVRTYSRYKDISRDWVRRSRVEHRVDPLAVICA